MSIQGGWTDDRVDRLTAMWTEGRTASEIKDALGYTSRSAVLGKVRRLGLPFRDKEETAANMYRMRFPGSKGGAAALAKAKAAKPKVEKPRRVIHAPATVSRVRMAPQPPSTPGKLLDVTAAKPWTQRAFGECAYPVSGEGAETFSCCLPAPAGATYCAGHWKVMVAKPATPGQIRAAAAARAARAAKRAA
jgi:GcrA cell cycle regulator